MGNGISIFLMLISITAIINLKSLTLASPLIPATQREFQNLLDKTARKFYIQNVESGKYISYKDGHDYPEPPKEPLEIFLFDRGIGNQVWKVQQGVGFPFRDGSFTAIHRAQLSDSDPFGQRNPSFSLRMWKIVEVEGTGGVYKIVKPFKPEDCLAADVTDGSPVTVENCDEFVGNTLWKFISAQ